MEFEQFSTHQAEVKLNSALSVFGVEFCLTTHVKRRVPFSQLVPGPCGDVYVLTGET